MVPSQNGSSMEGSLYLMLNTPKLATHSNINVALSILLYINKNNNTYNKIYKEQGR